MPTIARRSTFFLSIAAALLLTAMLVPIPSARADVTFVVDVVADDAALSACTLAPGDCSLRGAVAAANATAGVDTIDFLIPAAQCPGGVCPITLTDGPVEISEAVTIDATTQPQNSSPQANVCATATEPSHMRIEVVADPTAGLNDHVFQITHATGSSTIRGFAFGDDSGAHVAGAIYAAAGGGHHFACNHFALDAAGQNHLGTADFFSGILVADAANGVIVGTDGDGSNDIAERNVFASGGYSMFINANSNNTIAGNYFGFSADGAIQVGAGLVFARQQSSNNVIGTNGDGISDELERNYFGSNQSVVLQGFADGNLNNTIAGNTFGMGPDGAKAPIASAIEILELKATNTGYEVTDNTIVTSDSGVGLFISGDADEATVLIDGNRFGLVSGSFPQNDYAIVLDGSGSSVISNNVITKSSSEGLVIRGQATLGSGSIGNCIVGNAAGVNSTSSSSVTFEYNWWGATDGPSASGSGSGDSVSGDVDFAPWLTNPPAQCNTAPAATDATFTINAGAAAGTPVGTVVAVDDGSDLAFDITAGDPAGVFAISPATGQITMVAKPDYPATASYSLTVEMTDTGSLSDTATITVNITNLAPVAIDAAFTIAEDAAVGTTVGTVIATDGDGDTLAYAITTGDSGGAFAIDGDGLLTVAHALDYETITAYSLTVSADDGFEPDTAAVAVTVTDVDDGPVVPSFDDVPLGHTFFGDIEWLAAAGITKGCNPPANDLFCPDASVTRGQMAAFLHRALTGTLTAGASPDFTDIDGLVFSADIEWLGAVGVTKGCNPPVNDQFCPAAVVTRQQMAAFLVRALGYSAGAGSDQFSDDDGSLFEADIERLANAGVTKGCNPPVNDLFCPSAAVTRAQMAAFLHRALGL